MLNTWVLLVICRMLDIPTWVQLIIGFEFIIETMAFGIKLSELADKD